MEFGWLFHKLTWIGRTLRLLPLIIFKKTYVELIKKITIQIFITEVLIKHLINILLKNSDNDEIIRIISGNVASMNC